MADAGNIAIRKRYFAVWQPKHWCSTYFLDEQWSPEQIENRLNKEDNPIQEGFSTIYRGIYVSVLEPKLSKG